jgi:hypothetical protein
MCGPMIVLAGILLATGSGFSVVLPLAACALMMIVMMRHRPLTVKPSAFTARTDSTRGVQAARQAAEWR